MHNVYELSYITIKNDVIEINFFFFLILFSNMACTKNKMILFIVETLMNNIFLFNINTKKYYLNFI